MKITCSKRSNSDQPVEAGLFNRKKKDAKPANMQEYLDKMNKAGDELDKLQQKALKKYGSNIQSADTLPGPGDYNPPEYDEPNYLDDEEEYVDVHIDAIVEIDESGSWEYEDTEYAWACPPDGKYWMSETYPDVYLDDCVGIVEKVDELMADKLPEVPGRYRIVGDASICFSIANIADTSAYLGVDEDGDPVFDESYYSDEAEADHIVENDELKNFECTSLDKDIESSTKICAGVTFNTPKPISSPRYDMHTSAQYRGVKFSIYYNEIDTSPEADPVEMFNQFKAQVSEIHPYDDGEYLSAVLDKGTIRHRVSGQSPRKQTYYLNASDMDVENSDWCDTVVEQAIKELRNLNSSVKSRIMHN